MNRCGCTSAVPRRARPGGVRGDSAWVREFAGSPTGPATRQSLTGGSVSAVWWRAREQFAPAMISPYVPHLVLGVLALVAAWTPPTVHSGARRAVAACPRRAAVADSCSAWRPGRGVRLRQHVVRRAGRLLGGDAGGMPRICGNHGGVTLGSGVISRLAGSPLTRPRAADHRFHVPVRAWPPAPYWPPPPTMLPSPSCWASATGAAGRGHGGGRDAVGPRDHAGLVAVFYVIAGMGTRT